MAVNPLLSLQLESVDTATPVRNLIQTRMAGEEMDLRRQQAGRQDEILDLRKQQLDLDRVKTAFEQQEAAEKRRFRNVAIGSMQLKNVLDSQGPEAAMQWLQNNQEGNQRIGLDSNDSQEAMEMLQSGNVDQLETSLSNNIILGESLDLIETPDQPKKFEPILDDQGNIIAQRDTASGKVFSDPRAEEGPDTEVNVSVGGEKFAETLNKQSAERINTLVETGRSAVATEQNLSQMGDLLAQGVETGAVTPLRLSIQAVAEDLGLDISEAAKKVGLESLEDVSSQEEFDRLAKTVIIDGFEKFKGNLNDREVKLAMDAFANLGRSEEANVDAIASLRASQAIAKERGRRASQVDSRAEAKALEAELFDDSLSKFQTLKKEFASDIRDRMEAKTEQARESGVPQSAIDAGVDTQIWNAMTPEERALFEDQ